MGRGLNVASITFVIAEALSSPRQLKVPLSVKKTGWLMAHGHVVGYENMENFPFYEII